MTQIWAHRGASAYASENTLPAFQLAADMGADGVELDVHLSLDGELMVAHDDTVDRCSSGTGWIKDMTLAQLKELDVSNRKAGYRGVRMPTLQEVYRLLKPTGLLINVEIKSFPVRYPGIEEKALVLAKAEGMEERVRYSSFNHQSLVTLKALDPAVSIAPLYSAVLHQPWEYAKTLGAQAIHPYHQTVEDEAYLKEAAAAGILVNPWTVDDPERIAQLSKWGAHAIITNAPDVARKALG